MTATGSRHAMVRRAAGARSHRGRRAALAFTLLEVMLALVILVAALGILIGAMSGGLKQVATAERETEATLHAQSLLDALGTLEPLRPGHADGETEDRRYRWSIDVEPVEDPAPINPGTIAPVPLQGGPQLLRITLVVTWGDAGPRQRLQFVTLRVRTPEEIGAAR